MKNQRNDWAARDAAFDKTHQKILDTLEEYVTGGWTQTLAKLLVYMEPERAESALKKLPQDLRENVTAEYSAMEGKKRTDADVISAAGFVLKNSGFYGKALAQDATENLGQKQISKMLLFCDELFEKDPLLAMNIENFSLTFDDICDLDDRSIQRILRELESQTLAAAIKNDIKAQKKFFKNMSRRAATMLKEDMEFMGPLKIADVEKAQKEVLQTVKALAAKGDIIIVGRLNYAERIL